MRGYLKLTIERTAAIKKGRRPSKSPIFYLPRSSKISGRNENRRRGLFAPRLICATAYLRHGTAVEWMSPGVTGKSVRAGHILSPSLRPAAVGRATELCPALSDFPVTPGDITSLSNLDRFFQSSFKDSHGLLLPMSICNSISAMYVNFKKLLKEIFSIFTRFLRCTNDCCWGNGNILEEIFIWK